MHKRKRRSEIWNYYEEIDKTVALCNLCKKNISYHSSVSNLKKHIERKHAHDLDPLTGLDIPDEVERSFISPSYNKYGKSHAGQHGANKPPQKRQIIEVTEINQSRWDANSVQDFEKAFKAPEISLRKLVDARKMSNSLKEQQLTVDKMRNEIFSHLLTVFRNMPENNHMTRFMREALCGFHVTSTSTKRKPESDAVNDEGELEMKCPWTRETYYNDDPEFNENWLKDLHIEESKIDIDERRLKLEERKMVMERQMIERKIEIGERKLKLEEQKVNSEDPNEEKSLELDEAQMKLSEQKFLLEVQMEEKKLEIDEKRLKLEKRKVFLQEQKKLCNGE